MVCGHTPLEALDLLECVLLRLGALLQLGNLDLLAELLQVAQLARLGGRLLVGCLLHQLRADLVDVLVALDHLGEVVRGAREGHLLGAQLGPADPGRLEALRVQRQLARDVVVDIGHALGRRLGGGHRLVRREGDGGVGREGDAGQRGEQGRGVVDAQALEGDQIVLLLLRQVLEVGHGDGVLLIVLLVVIIILVVIVCRGRRCERLLALGAWVCGGRLLRLGLSDNLLLQLD